MSTHNYQPDSYRVSTTNCQPLSGVFITFSGNCKEALTFYQTCFGGWLQFETFDKELQGYSGNPVLIGSLVSDSVVIHGSDLVHNEGRKIGNYLSIFIRCRSLEDRRKLAEKLQSGSQLLPTGSFKSNALTELTDAFDVRWVLGL